MPSPVLAARNQEEEWLNSELLSLPIEIKRCIVNLTKVVQEEISKEEKMIQQVLDDVVKDVAKDQ